MKTNVVLCSRQLSAMIVAAMAISPIQAQTMSFFRQFTTPGMDRAIAVAADASGVYVFGRDFPPNASYLRKYSPDGAEVWTTRFGDPNNPDYVVALAVDTTGAYLVGLAGQGPVRQQFSFVRKYDSRGNELWSRQF